MANFMGPMAPPQAAPQQPPQMDVRTSPNQRAQFKNFMSNIGMGVPPLSLAPPIPTTPSPMMNVDIFSASSPQMFYAGGPVGGGGADSGQMAANTFTGTLDSSSPRLERNDALSDILSAAPAATPEPVYNMPNPVDMALQSVQSSLPAPVQGIMSAANNAMGAVKRGVTMPGPGGLGSFNIRPVIQQSGLGLPSLEGFDANYTLNFEDGGPVQYMRYGGSTMGLGSSGQASGFSSVNDRAEQAERDRVEGNDQGETRSISPELSASLDAAKAAADSVRQANEFVSAQTALDLARDRQTANEFVDADRSPDRSGQMGGFFDYFDEKGENLNDPDIFGVAGGPYDVGSGFETVTQSQDFFNDIMRIPTMLQSTPSIMGYGLGRTILSPESFKQSAIDFLDAGGVFDPETGVLTRPEGEGTMTMNRFGNVTYSGPRSSDPSRFAAIGDRDEAIDVMQPVAAAEVDPCPPGYELKDGVCQPSAPNQVGDTVTPSTPMTPAPSVVVPSPRPPVGPLRGPASYQGPATFSQSATLTPEFFQNLLTPAPRPLGMKDGGSVLDAAADQFLMGLRAA